MEKLHMEDVIRHALSPTSDEIRAAPLSSHARIAAEHLGKSRRRALDVGCGDGKFTRVLATICSDVSGIDVQERKIAEAREAAQAAGLKIDFRVASAEDLPFPDASLDVVVFSNSLHHIPRPEVALREAIRVLVPEGVLYIMEPVPAGNYQEATRLVNDETIVRTDAYRAVLATVGKGGVSAAELIYRSPRQFADFEEWKADEINRDERRRMAFDADPDLVRRTFEGHAAHEDGRLAFDQVFRVNLLKKVAPGS
jgi:ubiquinone/menaquinone biosynthesis C-methylase UbiE